MADNHADRLDGEVLGEEIGDDGLPGVGDYPPDQAQGVNDPNLVARDDVAMREARTRSEEVPGREPRTGDVLPPAGDDDVSDTEQQLLADRAPADDEADRADPPAEVAALREIESPE